MNMIVLGINHKTAPIEIREKFYLTHLQQDLFLSELKSNPAIAEGLVLSTCNRTEVYLNTIGAFHPLDFVIRLIADIKKIELVSELKKYFYTYEDEVAIGNLFQV